MNRNHSIFLSGAVLATVTVGVVAPLAIHAAGCRSFSAKTYPERNDDFAWENDIVAFRAYGPQTRRNGEKSFGYDIFLKYPGKGLILEELYAVQTDPANWAKVDSLRKIDPEAAKDFENSFTYHVDHGKGMDCYAVGPTLGCGASALMDDGHLVMPWTYETVEIIADTPDSLVFRLDFPPAVAGRDTVTEHRKIRLDKSTHLNYCEVYYEGLSSERKIAAGFPLRDGPLSFASASDGIVAVADPTQGPDNGKALVGLYVPGGADEVIEVDGHLVATSTVAPGMPFRYYWGYAWDRTDIPSFEKWVEYLKSYRNRCVSRLMEVGDGYSRTSVNTAVFREGSLATHGDTQYIAYYNPQGHAVVGKRKLGSDEWMLSDTGLTGNVADGHNVISIGVDGQGYIHLAFDHHGNPLKYTRSTMPGGLDFMPLSPMVGNDENDVTYPEFHTMPDGSLLFAYRSGASGNGNLVLNAYYPDSRQWKRVQDVLIDGEGKRNAYWQMHVDEKGMIHISWVWRETWMVETNHDLCYARSADGGLTWQRSDGSYYNLPITLESAETVWKIPQNSELINQTSMTADSDGNPYIATYWRDADSDVPQYRLVWHDASGWHAQQVGQRTAPFSLSGGGTKMIPISRPRIVSDGRSAWYVFRDSERGSKVSLAYTSDLASGIWTTQDLTDFPVDAWEPSIDTNLWNSDKKLHVFVQETHQGDGEKVAAGTPEATKVYVLEYSINETE